MPKDGAFTNQIQTKCLCYSCFVLQCVSRSKGRCCAWHKEQFCTVGPVQWNIASDLADGKPWVSMTLSRKGFTMPTHVNFLALGLSTNVPLTLITSWLLALYARRVLYIMVNRKHMASQKLSARLSWSRGIV